MDETGRNQNEMGNESAKEPQWDNTYGKKSLPQISNPYGIQNVPYGEQRPPKQNVAEQISSFGPPVQPYLPPRKSHKKGIFIALGVLLALILLCVGAGWISHVSSASYKIKKGFEKMDQEWVQMKNPLAEKLGADEITQMMEEDGSHIDARLNFTADTYGYGDMTLGVDVDYYKDMRRKEMDVAASLSIMNYDFAHFNFYGDEDVVCFSIPELFIEDLYIETEDVAKQYNRSMWADSYLFGEMDEDYSIDLFPETVNFRTVHSWQDVRESLGQHSDHLETCLQKARIEKAGKGKYRVILDAMEVNHLLRDLLESYEEMLGEDMYDILSYLQLVNMGDDISLLFDIDQGGHIRKISFEEPVRLLDNQIKLEGELLFLGQKRSIDLIRGQIVLWNEDDEKIEFTWQMDQTLSSDADKYDAEIDMKCNVMDEELDMKYTVCFDAEYDEFRANLSMKDEWGVYKFFAEGGFDDIKPGKSYEVDVRNFSVEMDGEELFKVTGEIKVEPLRGNIKRSAEAGRAFFELTEEDWERILDRIDEEYGSLWDLLP